MRNSRSTRGEARPGPPPVSFAALLIQDATHVDPIVDAWGQDLVRGLIEGIQAGFRELSAALAMLIEVGRSLLLRRAPSRPEKAAFRPGPRCSTTLATRRSP